MTRRPGPGFKNGPGEKPPNFEGEYKPDPLTSEELTALIAQCNPRAPTGIRNRAMIMLLSRSGLRVSEMLGDPRRGKAPMRASSVNFKTHSIRLLATKSKQAQTRGFHPSADDALMRWIDKRKELGLAVNGTPLFCTLDGEPVSAEYVRAMLKRLATRAGIDKRVHPHGLRHTFAAELEAAGVPVSVISDLLGHSSVAVTSRYLKHLTNEQAISRLVATDLPSLE